MQSLGNRIAPKNFTGALSYMTGKGAKTARLGDPTAMVLLVSSWQTQSSMISFLICEMGTRHLPYGFGVKVIFVINVSLSVIKLLEFLRIHRIN